MCLSGIASQRYNNYTMSYVSDLYSAESLILAAKRIPTDKTSKWNTYVVRISKDRQPTLFDLQNWLQDCVSVDFNPYTYSSW